MNEEKAWWQSRTIIGIVVMLLAQVLKWLHVDIVNEELTDIVTIAMEAAGAGLAVYGRVKARKTIRRTKPGGMFNPHAEVRRASPVRNKIFGLFLMMVTCSYGQMYPSNVWYENPIRFTEVVDQRPFFVRLFDSLKCSIALFPLKGEIKGSADF
jgi:uncharacterized membrane protein